MIAVNYSNIRKNFKSYCDKVNDENETIIVTRKNEKNIVIISLDDWNKLQKIVRNAQYLSKIERSLSDIKNGSVITKTIQELEDMEK